MDVTSRQRLALVTGGAGDIGVAIARRLAADGFRVGLVDRNGEALTAAAGSIEGAVALPGDVTDEGSCRAVVEAFGGRLDCLVNNAGIGRFGALHELSTADFRAVVEVNLVGPYLMARAAFPAFVANGGGAIVNITSINALTPGPGAGAYPAAKAGLARLTEQMALEWRAYGIRANSVAPGFIDGGISRPFYADPAVRKLRGGAVPVGRLGVCEDIANAVAYLASDEASYVNGHQLVVDGGVVPSLLMQLPREVKGDKA